MVQCHSPATYSTASTLSIYMYTQKHASTGVSAHRQSHVSKDTRPHSYMQCECTYACIHTHVYIRGHMHRLVPILSASSVYMVPQGIRCFLSVCRRWVLVLLPFLPRADRKTGSSDWFQSQAHSIQPVRESQASEEKLFPFPCSLSPSGRVTPDLFKWETVIFALN